jgi:hypothetical protein
MKAYLSIDLDYWRASSRQTPVVNFFKKVFAMGLPIMVALHHHHLVRDINSKVQDFDTLINVDYHSDLSDENFKGLGPLELEEGTWANFIHFRGDGHFIWRYPILECLQWGEGASGYCHRRMNPFVDQDVSGWEHTTMIHGVAHLPWNKIGAIGVCLSPGWLEDSISILSYPLEMLDLYEWLGRWAVHNGFSDYHG